MAVIAYVACAAVFGATWPALLRSDGGSPLRPRPSALLLWCAVAVPSLLQLSVAPGLVSAGRRDVDAITHGEVWRLVTSMFFQDAGWWGAIFNLVTLAGTSLLAGRVLSGRAMVGLFLAGGVVANLIVIATVAEDGAGNSMATMGLAIVALGVAHRRGTAPVAPFVVVGLAGVVLAALRDVHGWPVLAALVVALAAARGGGLSPRGGSPA